MIHSLNEISARYLWGEGWLGGRYGQMAIGKARNTIYRNGPGPSFLPILQKLHHHTEFLRSYQEWAV